MDKDGFHWYSLIVRKNSEETLIRRIKGELVKKKELSNSIKELVFLKNFRGFIFCQIKDIDAELIKFIRSFKGVITFLDSLVSPQGSKNKKLSAKPSLIIPRFIEDRKFYALVKEEEEEEKEIFEQEAPRLSLEVGDSIRVMKGLFRLYEGTVVQTNPRTGQVSVELNYDGQNNLIKPLYLERLPSLSCLKIS